MQALGQEPRQTTSNLGHLQKPSIQVHTHTASIIVYYCVTRLLFMDWVDIIIPFPLHIARTS